MRFYDINLDEAFDSNVEGEVIRATNNLFTTSATIGNRKIIFNAAMYEGANNESIWEIDFLEKSPGNVTYSKTGSGSEMQVFSFVINSIKELVSRYSPDEIEFSSHKADANRSLLYKKMLNRVKINGYHPAEVKSDEHTDIFRIVRDDK